MPGSASRVAWARRFLPPLEVECYNRSMSIFRRGSRRPRFGPQVMKMDLSGGTTVTVFPCARGERARVHVAMQAFTSFCSGDFTEDQVRALAKAMQYGIERSKAFTVGGG